MNEEDNTMGPDRLNEIIRSNEIGAEKAPIQPASPTMLQMLGRSRVGRPLFTALTVVAPFLGSSIARANTEVGSNTPAEPTIELTMDGLPALDAQTPPAEAVAGVVDVAEPIIEPAPTPELPAVVKPEYVSPGGFLTIIDYPGTEKIFRPNPEKIAQLEKELSDLKVRITLVADENITKDMVKPGLGSKDGAINLDSCLDISTFDPKFAELDCYNQDWFLLMPYYPEPERIELHYKLMKPDRAPTEESWIRLVRNFNNSYIPTYIAQRDDPDANSALALQLRPRFRAMSALTVQSPIAASAEQENS